MRCRGRPRTVKVRANSFMGISCVRPAETADETSGDGWRLCPTEGSGAGARWIRLRRRGSSRSRRRSWVGHSDRGQGCEVVIELQTSLPTPSARSSPQLRDLLAQRCCCGRTRLQVAHQGFIDLKRSAPATAASRAHPPVTAGATSMPLTTTAPKSTWTGSVLHRHVLFLVDCGPVCRLPARWPRLGASA
jgi:hypothetical protein